MRVLLYHRLARDDSMAMECQKNYLRSWAAENSCIVIDEIAEVGSGLRLDCPACLRSYKLSGKREWMPW